MCFSGAQDGWLGANGQLYRTGNGGTTWTALTAPPATNEGGYVASMSVECAGPDAAWAVRAGPGAGMSQQPHVAYHADAHAACDGHLRRAVLPPDRRPDHALARRLLPGRSRR